jgi:hypothetical protein
MTLDERLSWYQRHLRGLERDRADATTIGEYWSVSRELIKRRREYHDVWMEWTTQRAAQHAADRARGFEHCQAAVARFHSSEHAA